MGSWWQPSFNRLEVRDKLCCSWRTRLSPQSCMKRFKCPPEFPIGMKGDLAHGKHFCVVVGTHIRVSIRIGYHGYPILSPSPDQSSSSLLTFEFSRVYAIFRHTHVESPYFCGQHCCWCCGLQGGIAQHVDPTMVWRSGSHYRSLTSKNVVPQKPKIALFIVHHHFISFFLSKSAAPVNNTVAAKWTFIPQHTCYDYTIQALTHPQHLFYHLFLQMS